MKRGALTRSGTMSSRIKRDCRNPLLAEESFETCRLSCLYQRQYSWRRNPLLAEESFETSKEIKEHVEDIKEKLSQSPISRGKF